LAAGELQGSEALLDKPAVAPKPGGKKLQVREGLAVGQRGTQARREKALDLGGKFC
jgi:hypothetical protein